MTHRLPLISKMAKGGLLKQEYFKNKQQACDPKVRQMVVSIDKGKRLM